MAEPLDGLFLPDVNVLVALTNPSHQHHPQARQWLANARKFATTPVTEVGLVRLLLNPSVTGQQVTGEQAVDLLSGLRSHDRAVFLADSSSLAAAGIDLIGLVGHRQATDFHLVNVAAAHGAVLATFDRRIAPCLTTADRKYVQTL